MIAYNIISTGSKGNAVLVHGDILIDCGVSYKEVAPYIKQLHLVLLTHIHSDHFKTSTIRRMAQERPTLRFVCCNWLLDTLLSAGVRAGNIDVMQVNHTYKYGAELTISPVALAHDVPNCGYRLKFPEGRVFYATDTTNLNGIEAKGYDLYMVEANYIDEEIRQRIAEKKESGEFIYEKRVLNTHLSKADCDDFIYRNIGPKGSYVYLHGHIGREDEECEDD